MKQNFSESNWPLDESVAEVIPQLDLFELEQFPQYPGALADWKPEWLAALPAKPRSEQCDFRIEAILESSGLGDWPLFVLQVGLWGRMIPGPLGRSYQRIYGSAYGAPVSPALFRQPCSETRRHLPQTLATDRPVAPGQRLPVCRS